MKASEAKKIKKIYFGWCRGTCAGRLWSPADGSQVRCISRFNAGSAVSRLFKGIQGHSSLFKGSPGRVLRFNALTIQCFNVPEDGSLEKPTEGPREPIRKETNQNQSESDQKMT